jgi:lipopolysaccharide O-acetyltransferase
LPGTIIGNGVVVGANSVVRGSIPENTVIAGVPAKIIKKYNHETKLWEKA